MSAHPIQWAAPEPLWARFGTTPEAAVTAPDQYRPAILRFASDDFMDQMIGMLGRDPMHLGKLLARPETWRTPPVASLDLVESVVVPSITKTTVRRRLFARAKTSVEPVPQKTTVKEKGPQRTLPLKLYQPAHQRYYLVSASLVCGIAGMPDRAVVQGGPEQLGYVVRRLLPATAGSTDEADLCEFAFVKDSQGPRWQRVSENNDAAQLAAGEELLPLFPLSYRNNIQHPRKLWTGFIPVGRREEYLGTTVDRSVVPLALGQRQSLYPAAIPEPEPAITARKTQFMMDVAEPWKVLVRAAYSARDGLADDLTAGQLADDLTAEQLALEMRKRAFNLNLQWQMQSWLILLDFADYLEKYLPDVWNVIDRGVGASELPEPRKKLYDWLGTVTMETRLEKALRNPTGNLQIKSPATSLRAALQEIHKPTVRQGLESIETLYGISTKDDPDWPNFHFLLAGVAIEVGTANTYTPAGAFTFLSNLSSNSTAEVELDPLAATNPLLADGQAMAAQLDYLTALVARSLERRPETDAPALPFALQLRDALAANSGDAGWFVIRCVYLNRDCGPLHPPTLSAASQRFQLANFFDSDAPARPIRVTLPLDTSAAGLRKHSRNTAFVISDMLCGQIQRAKGLGLGDLVRSVLPWPLHKDLDVGAGGACNNGSVNIGMICSLSIPIITICALILLMIIVSLLDFIFRWLPYFVFCFPLPKFKGKTGDGS